MRGHEEKGSFSLSAVGQGVFGAASFVLGFTLLTAALFYFAPLPERLLPYFASSGLFLGSFAGGVLAARRAASKVLLHGLTVGTVLFILLWFTSLIFYPGPVVTAHLLKKLFLLLLGGALGSTLGATLIPSR
ncbi:TIGR04086 family membrane protein [Ammonifex thiophilus]|uniref:TIGR04086 family membrane protein n=1 Tax=Ammonifex thiophilus TaxID=444093 RepID=A0A3D8P896_9THEO|nr:TIGR04086 family membrane protein [Ammonifex thiophilus]RDV84711.1 TIGR04086 family membrane protein [Ammonifex thiophilus]